VLGFQDEIAEGTGMILTSGGEILTNNHVIEDATSITVTIITTGTTYPATVVGTDQTADVAVLQLSSASGLSVATFGDSTTVGVSDAVVGVGNAGGVGGAATAAPGIVLALNQSITATIEGGGTPEHLSGLIASNAQIQPGDSGGPLFNQVGLIVGLDTAGGQTPSGEIVAFSIPINTALSIARQIQQGTSSPTIQLGSPALLGVSAVDAPAGAGALVQQVRPNTPAADAGIETNDVITQVDGQSVQSASALNAALGTHRPGDRVTIDWTRASAAGSEQLTATETLIAGPAL
jgi:S1-C subfamily serine protease